jgi:hypothetical protein
MEMLKIASIKKYKFEELLIEYLKNVEFEILFFIKPYRKVNADQAVQTNYKSQCENAKICNHREQIDH